MLVVVSCDRIATARRIILTGHRNSTKTPQNLTTPVCICRSVRQPLSTHPVCPLPALYLAIRTVPYHRSRKERLWSSPKRNQVLHSPTSCVLEVCEVWGCFGDLASFLEASLGDLMLREHNLLVLLGCRTRLGHPYVHTWCVIPFTAGLLLN